MESNFLTAKPSFLSGSARTLDLWGVFDDYNYSLTPEQADQIAMLLDWYVTGQDIQAGLNEYEEQRQALPETCSIGR